MEPLVITVSCLKHIYPDTTEIHICGLDFVVKRGERVVILGGNGSGKTTLLYHVLGLLAPDEGRVSVFGVNPSSHYNAIRERIGVLLQSVDEQILSPTVWDDISFSPRNYGYDRKEIAQMVEQIMSELGILHLRDKICHYLSGGEKRKVEESGKRKVYFETDGGWESTPIIQRGEGWEGTIEGPAVVEQYDATTIIYPGWRVETDGVGNLVLGRDK
jgi:cobalt/nickel transport system ATP-binding protein